MATISYTDMTAVELTAKSRDLRRDLFHLRQQQTAARLEKPHRLAELRREIARCETRLTAARKAPTKS